MDTDLITEYRGHNVEEFDMLLVELLEAVTRPTLVLVSGEILAEAAIHHQRGSGGDSKRRTRRRETGRATGGS